MIGKYERGDNSPSIEVIVKLAKAFDVSVDNLLGEGLNASYDKEMVKRLDELENCQKNKKAKFLSTWISSFVISKLRLHTAKNYKGSQFLIVSL